MRLMGHSMIPLAVLCARYWNLEEPEKRIKFGSITILVNKPEEE